MEWDIFFQKYQINCYSTCSIIKNIQCCQRFEPNSVPAWERNGDNLTIKNIIFKTLPTFEREFSQDNYFDPFPVSLQPNTETFSGRTEFFLVQNSPLGRRSSQDMKMIHFLWGNYGREFFGPIRGAAMGPPMEWFVLILFFWDWRNCSKIHYNKSK